MEPSTNPVPQESTDSVRDHVLHLAAPLSREQLLDLVCEAAENDAQLFAKLKELSLSNPNSRKLFVRGEYYCR